MADFISNPPLSSLLIDGSHQIEQALRSTFAENRASMRSADPKLEIVCQEMESLFLSYLLKEMRATISHTGLVSGGTAEQIFTAMLDTEMAKAAASRGGIGLSKLLVDQLAHGSDDPAD